MEPQVQQQQSQLLLLQQVEECKARQLALQQVQQLRLLMVQQLLRGARYLVQLDTPHKLSLHQLRHELFVNVQFLETGEQRHLVAHFHACKASLPTMLMLWLEIQQEQTHQAAESLS
jgi:hypothetical protein